MLTVLPLGVASVLIDPAVFSITVQEVMHGCTTVMLEVNDVKSSTRTSPFQGIPTVHVKGKDPSIFCLRLAPFRPPQSQSPGPAPVSEAEALSGLGLGLSPAQPFLPPPLSDRQNLSSHSHS